MLVDIYRTTYVNEVRVPVGLAVTEDIEDKLVISFIIQMKDFGYICIKRNDIQLRKDIELARTIVSEKASKWRS